MYFLEVRSVTKLTVLIYNMKENNNTWFYRYLELPKIPDEFQIAAKKQIENEQCEWSALPELNHPLWEKKLDLDEKQISYPMFRKIDYYGKEVSSRSVLRYKISKDFETWIKQNICSNFLDASIAPYHKINDNDDILGVHTDTTRDYLLFYLLEKSNDDQITAWWQERGFPIVRERNAFTNDFNSLDKLSEVMIEKERWIVINARILHSVHNILGYRNAVQISINNLEDILD